MKKFLLILPLCCWLTAVPALNVDSLWGLWNDKTQPDTVRLNAMHKIAKDGYLYSQPDSAFYFAGLQYEFAKSVNDKNWMLNALLTQGASFYIKGNYEKALELYQKSLGISEEQGNKIGMANSYNNIGLICHDQGNYEEELNYYKKSLKIFQELGNKSGIAATLNNIGRVYNIQDNNEEALNYYKKSLKIQKETGNKFGIASSLNNIGVIYRHQGNYDKALGYYKKSLRIKEEIGDQKGMAHSLSNIGLVYNIQDNNEEAFNYYKKSLKIHKEIGDKYGMSASLANIGIIYYNQGNYAKALTYVKDALKLSQQINALDFVDDYSKQLYEIYKKTGNSKKALQMYELYTITKDTLAKKSANEQAIKLEAKRKYEEKKLADSIRNRELAKVKDAQLFAQKAKLKQEKIIRYGLIGGLLVIALSLLLIIRSYKQKLLAREQLGIKNKEINKLKGQEIERIRIAKELHDGLGGSLAGIKMRLGSLAKDKNSDVADLNELSVQVGEACREVRNISHNLMPPVITDRHITEAIGEFVNEFGRSSGLKINLNCFPEGNLNKLDNLVQIDLYRIVQELLNNVYKHAGANKVEIGLMMDEEGINLMVEDDGSGFDPKKSTDGIGLSNIHSRVEALGGTVKVDSQKKRGTAIHINIILKQTA